MFVDGQEYRRRELHARYGGQEQGGISTPSQHPFIFLFATPNGEKHGYFDGPKPNGQYLFTGEGQHGDMEFLRGNRAIQNHQLDRKSLYMFEQTRTGHVRFYGEMRVLSHYFKKGPDTDGRMRDVIVFVLERMK